MVFSIRDKTHDYWHCLGWAMSSKAIKKANNVAPAWVSKVSSGNIDSSMMVRNTIYK